MPTLTDYSVGDLVVLGHDGVARIEDISSVDIDGEAATMLKLTVLSARMTVTIPLERALVDFMLAAVPFRRHRLGWRR